MKPIVLVDIDDTLSATQVTMLQYINARSDHQYTWDELTRQHREHAVPEYDRLIREFLNQPEEVRQTPPYADALTAMQRLHESGYEIHILSSRRENLHEITLNWLEEHGFTDYIDHIHPRSSQHKGDAFKQAVVASTGAVAAFDDTYDVALAMASAGVHVFLIHKPWNAGEELPNNVTRCDSFAQAVEHFLV